MTTAIAEMWEFKLMADQQLEAAVVALEETVHVLKFAQQEAGLHILLLYRERLDQARAELGRRRT